MGNSPEKQLVENARRAVEVPPNFTIPLQKLPFFGHNGTGSIAVLRPDERNALNQHQVIGSSVPRKEGLGKVTGRARYADDMTLPGMLYDSKSSASVIAALTASRMGGG